MKLLSEITGLTVLCHLYMTYSSSRDTKMNLVIFQSYFCDTVTLIHRTVISVIFAYFSRSQPIEFNSVPCPWSNCFLSVSYPWGPDLCYAVTQYHRLGGRCVLSQCSEGWKSKIKVLAGLIPSEGCEGRVAQAPLFDSEGLVFILHLFTLSPR